MIECARTQRQDMGNHVLPLLCDENVDGFPERDRVHFFTMCAKDVCPEMVTQNDKNFK